MSEATTQAATASLFEGYRLGRAWDEMLADAEHPRTPYRAVFHTLRAMSAATLREQADILARSYLDQGVTFDYAGEERPFPLDAVPRVLSAHEWSVIDSGVVQRVTALESLLDDIYSREGEIPRAVHEGIVPWRLIASSKHYHRAVMGIRPANGVRVHVSGVDLIRDEEGTFRVLEDNVRVPSGVSYVIANRRAMANVFPEAFATMRIRPVGGRGPPTARPDPHLAGVPVHARRHRRPARADAARPVGGHRRLARDREPVLPGGPAADLDQGRDLTCAATASSTPPCSPTTGWSAPRTTSCG